MESSCVIRKVAACGINHQKHCYGEMLTTVAEHLIEFLGVAAQTELIHDDHHTLRLYSLEQHKKECTARHSCSLNEHLKVLHYLKQASPIY